MVSFPEVAWYPDKGYVYFIHAPEVCRVKIGHSRDIESRMRAMDTGEQALRKQVAKGQ